MSRFLTLAIPGIPIGCVYALVAAGLVLTFKTSGVFNLAFGAQAYVSALAFYVMVEEHGWPKPAAFIVAVVVLSPALGLLFDRAIFRYMRTTTAGIKLIAALGLLVGIPELAKLFFGDDAKLRPPSIAPNPDHVYRFGDYHLDGTQLVTVLVTVAVVIALTALLRFTALGLKMRAVVESARMVELAGIPADRIGSVAWLLSSFLAGLAGVLLAPLFASVDAANFTVLLVAAIAAAAFGRLSSVGLALAGGVLLGIGQQALAGYLPLGSILATGLRPSFPFLVLVALLLFWPGLRSARETRDPLAACDPPPPALAATMRDPGLDRVIRIAFPVFLATFMAVALFGLSSYYLFLLTQGIVMSTIFLSITVLTGMSGQLSLCQATFAGVGAFTAGQLAVRWNVPFLGGMLIGGAVAALLGMLVALPALRLGGLYLALATLAFALLADNVLFPLDWVGKGVTGVAVPRPQLGPIDFTANRSFFLLAMAVFGVCAFVVILVRKGTTGRYLAALRGSELAASTIGIDPVRSKITVFALSAAIAGVGGAMFGSLQQSTGPNDYNFFFSLVFMVLVLTTGTRTVEGAVNAGMAFVLFPEILSHLPGSLVGLQYVLFGYGAVNFAKHPEGIVEFQKRVSTERLARWRARRRHDAAPAEQAA